MQNIACYNGRINNSPNLKRGSLGQDKNPIQLSYIDSSSVLRDKLSPGKPKDDTLISCLHTKVCVDI